MRGSRVGAVGRLPWAPRPSPHLRFPGERFRCRLRRCDAPGRWLDGRWASGAASARRAPSACACQPACRDGRERRGGRRWWCRGQPNPCGSVCRPVPGGWLPDGLDRGSADCCPGDCAPELAHRAAGDGCRWRQRAGPVGAGRRAGGGWPGRQAGWAGRAAPVPGQRPAGVTGAGG